MASMEFHLLSFFALLFVLVVVRGDASVPAEVYWHSKLPNTPIPQDLLNLLQHMGDKYTYWDMGFNADETLVPSDDRRIKYGKRYEQAFAEDTNDRREKYGKRYEQAFAEDTSDRREKYGKRYEQAFAEDTNDRREKYGKRYEQAFTEDTTTDRREKYGKRYEQAFAEDTSDRREKYGKRYEQAFAEDTSDRREKYGKRYEQAFAEDTSDRREKYGKRYEQAFAEDTSDRREKYGKRYEQAFAEDTTDRREKYGKRYERKFNKHALPNSTVFFLPNDLHVGKRMRLHITKSSNKARILPQQVADTLPFSTNNLAEILKRFSVKPESRQGKMIKQTVEDCESPAIKGEDRYCPRSLESLVDFGVKHVGNKAQVLMNEVDKPTREQEYTIMGVKFIGENHVVCHKQKYPYAVYYCHALKGTKVYMAPVIGADGTKAKAVAICHTDTSNWNPGHLAFLLLNMKPGEGTVCHFIRSDTFVMVSSSDVVEKAPAPISS
ncbi:hypothetical protein P3X46_023907 [Hevea brasiliensis]|uniref:BURP domain-containing protein n=1 Tax=Hevea brasiliensis TaxID=3981 RepID=A0ABQ9LEE3_HEVBR|nr:BURP domain-containing protein 9-like [Hevea brasiliensis]KAJ9164311.1 hypothetical protein P3X46_023907 [Hevea brasiliensis]